LRLAAHRTSVAGMRVMQNRRLTKNRMVRRVGALAGCLTLVPALIVATMTLAATAATWIDGDRVTLQALDKITARISTLEMAVGTRQTFGTLEVTVEKCAFHPPEEPPESAAFLTIRDIGYGNQPAKTAFAGWMFASSPAVSALEHPVYDITILACTTG
jgi:hypothetical protein